MVRVKCHWSWPKVSGLERLSFCGSTWIHERDWMTVRSSVHDGTTLTKAILLLTQLDDESWLLFGGFPGDYFSSSSNHSLLDIIFNFKRKWNCNYSMETCNTPAEKLIPVTNQPLVLAMILALCCAGWTQLCPSELCNVLDIAHQLLNARVFVNKCWIHLKFTMEKKHTIFSRPRKKQNLGLTLPEKRSTMYDTGAGHTQDTANLLLLQAGSSYARSSASGSLAAHRPSIAWNSLQKQQLRVTVPCVKGSKNMILSAATLALLPFFYLFLDVNTYIISSWLTSTQHGYGGKNSLITSLPA